MAGNVHRLRLLLQPVRWMKRTTTDQFPTLTIGQAAAKRVEIPRKAHQRPICIRDVDVRKMKFQGIFSALARKFGETINRLIELRVNLLASLLSTGNNRRRL